MSLLAELVSPAYAAGASDLHLEPGLPPAMRIRGQLQLAGEPVPGQATLEAARQLAGADGWPSFLQRRSLDLSLSIQGVRCRVNLFRTARGVGLSLRLLSGSQVSLESLNLHPSLKDLAQLPHGLVVVSGATGSGKSSTIAALVQEINQHEARHIISIEHPIEHLLRSRHALIRQREVGRDTPSFEQALLDALREDPDVLVVGEMRSPETIRLTLNAAETGHLVFTSLHSSSVTEALQRIVAAFPAEQQSSVCAQLAECLAAVVCQRLSFRPDLAIRVPECEILRGTGPVKAIIRQNQLAKLASAITTGGSEGMWTRDRYRRWLAQRERFHLPSRRPRATSAEAEEPLAPPLPALEPPSAPHPPAKTAPRQPAARPATKQDGVYDLEESGEDLLSILDELGSS